MKPFALAVFLAAAGGNVRRDPLERRPAADPPAKPRPRARRLGSHRRSHRRRRQPLAAQRRRRVVRRAVV